ncbi:MAG: hypothetical protein WDM96_09280 [Lacunisphaera sp.]
MTGWSSKDGELETSTTTEAPGERDGQALARDRVDTRGRRSCHDLVAELAEMGDDLGTDETRAADHHDFHDV